MINKHDIPTKLLWLDLEMTGLDPSKDLILEVAALITDFTFQPLANYKAIIKQDEKSVKARMAQNNWWDSFPKNRDEFLRNVRYGVPSNEVEQNLVNIVNEQFKTEPVILAGNSVHMDRAFIHKNWPQLYQKLHYRMLDVSSFKIFMQGKYGIEFEKKESHRAVDDIHESIAELEYYHSWFKNHYAEINS